MNLLQVLHDILITDGTTNIMRQVIPEYDVFRRYKLIMTMRNEFHVTK